MSMRNNEDDGIFVYVGIWNGLRVAVMVDRPEYKRETAKEMSRWIRQGYDITRESLIDFRQNGLSKSSEIQAALAKKKTTASDDLFAGQK